MYEEPEVLGRLKVLELQLGDILVFMPSAQMSREQVYEWENALRTRLAKAGVEAPFLILPTGWDVAAVREKQCSMPLSEPYEPSESSIAAAALGSVNAHCYG